MSRPLDLHAAPGGVYVIAQTTPLGIVIACGETVPSDGAVGFAPGCQFFQLDGSTEATYRYVNVGTKASANFDAVDLNVTEAGLISGLLATSDELNRATDLSTRIVNTTATVLAVTLTQHSDKIVVVDSAAPITITLPAAAGTGAKYTFVINTAATATSHVITCGTLDILKGAAHVASTTTDDVDTFLTTATDDKLELNGTTKGGLGGDRIEIIDSKLSVYHITAWLCGSGTIVTGFAAT